MELLMTLLGFISMVCGVVIVPNVTQAYRKWYSGDSIKENVISITISAIVFVATVVAAMFINGV